MSQDPEKRCCVTFWDVGGSLNINSNHNTTLELKSEFEIQDVPLTQRSFFEGYSITYYDEPLQPGILPRWSDQNVLGGNAPRRTDEGRFPSQVAMRPQNSHSYFVIFYSKICLPKAPFFSYRRRPTITKIRIECLV